MQKLMLRKRTNWNNFVEVSLKKFAFNLRKTSTLGFPLTQRKQNKVYWCLLYISLQENVSPLSRAIASTAQLWVRKERQFIIYKFTYNCSQEYSLFLIPQGASF